MQFSYETVGNTSYLVATFPHGEEIVNYQLQMLTNNEINNILPSTKRQKNDDVQVFYNITSRIPLSQVLSRRKIVKQELIQLIRGALGATDDLAEYQLVGAGIDFDAERIFVMPDSLAPQFVYLPIHAEDGGLEPLKNFLMGLIVGSKVELTNDNFVQLLLEAINNPALTTDGLQKLCDSAASQGAAYAPRPTPQQPVQPAQPQVRRAPSQKRAPQQPVQPAQPVQPQPRPNTPPAPPVQPQQPVQKKAAGQPAAKEKQSAAGGGKKTLFLVLQLVFLAVLALAFLSGFLRNEDGSLNSAYLLGIVLVIGATDFILYREWFKPKTDGAEKPEKAKKAAAKPAQKPPKAPNVAIPGKAPAAPPAPPVQKPVQQPVQQPVQEPVQSPVQSPVQQPVQEPVQSPVQSPVQQSVPQAAYIPAQRPTSVEDFERTVVLDTPSIGGDAYLEIFENGLAKRMPLNRPSIVVGRLRTQCDYPINNNKIGRVHAEFISRDGAYFVKDCNSTNGTYVNGDSQRIPSNTEVQIFDGDRITLADTDLTLHC